MGFSDGYPLTDWGGQVHGIPIALLNPIRFVMSAFFPIDTETLKAVLGGASIARGQFEELAWIRGGVAGVVNVAIWVVWLALVSKHGTGRTKLLLPGVLGLFAGVVPIVLKADPRFMYFSQMILVPLSVSVALEAIARWGSPTVYQNRLRNGACVVLALSLGPGFLVAKTWADQSRWEEFNRLSMEYRTVLLQEMARPAVERVYLLNDGPGMGGLAKLKFYAHLAGHPELRLRLVSQLVRYDPKIGSREGGVGFTASCHVLSVKVVTPLAGDLMGYLEPDEAARLGEAGLIEYDAIREFRRNPWGRSMVLQRALEFRIPCGGSLDYTIVGLDPAEAGVHIFDPASGRWSRASTGGTIHGHA